MKVLLTHSSAEMYGSDRMAAEAAGALVDAGHEVTVVLPAEGPLAERMRSMGARVSCFDVPVLRKANLRPGGLLALLTGLARTVPSMWRAISEVGPAVIYVNTITQPWWLVLARLRGLPSVVHVREAEPQLPRVVKTALMLPMLLSDMVVCNSQSTRDGVTQAVPMPSGRLRVVYNGKDWRRYQAPAEQAPLRDSDDVLTIVLIGRLSPRKGQDVAIQALSELASAGVRARLRLVGDVFPGYEWYEQELSDLATSLGVDNSVDFLGFCEDVRPELSRASVAVVPSRIEPFGTVAAESMAAGVLTIVAQVQGLTEIVTDQETGLTFPSGDASALAACCRWTVEHPQQAQQVREAGRESVLRRFTPERYRAGVVEAIEAVVPSRAAVGA